MQPTRSVNILRLCLECVDGLSTLRFLKQDFGMCNSGLSAQRSCKFAAAFIKMHIINSALPVHLSMLGAWYGIYLRIYFIHVSVLLHYVG